jgi:ferredoxin
MPWVDDVKCTGCGVCVEECPVDVIWMKNEKAVIDMKGCIRCGICHDVCPTEAVRHDSEKIPTVVKDNIEKTKRCINTCAKYLGEEEKWKCLERITRSFNREKIIAEKTLKELKKLKKRHE